MADSLQSHGVQLNGLMLMSTVLDIGALFDRHDSGFINMVPTQAAVAWYHNRLQNKTRQKRWPISGAARAFAAGPYAEALHKGDALPAAERDAIAQKLGAYIGISPQVLIENNLRHRLTPVTQKSRSAISARPSIA